MGTAPGPAGADGNQSTPSDAKLASESSSKTSDDVSTAAMTQPTETPSSIIKESETAVETQQQQQQQHPAASFPPPAVAKPIAGDEVRQQRPHGPADNSETDSADEIGASANATAEANAANTNPSLHSNGNVVIGQVCYH